MTEEQILLQEAARELRSLRRANELMAARLDTFDKCILLLQTIPVYQGQGMSEDLAWKIERHLKDSSEDIPF